MNLIIISPIKKITLYHNKQGFVETSMIDVMITNKKTLFLLRTEDINFIGFLYNPLNETIFVNVETNYIGRKHRNFHLRFYEKIEPKSWFCMPVIKPRVRQVKIKSIVEKLNQVLGGV